MFLVREDLLECIEQGRLHIAPFDLSRPETRKRVQTVSIDLVFGTTYAEYRLDTGIVTQRMPRRVEDIDERAFTVREAGVGQGITVPPLGFMLAAVDVRLRMPHDLMAFVEGKSTRGRAGMFAQNAGVVEPGFEGVLVCEIFNAAPIPLILTAGRTEIAQLTVAGVSRTTEYPYGTAGLGSRYQGQSYAQPPRPERHVA